MDLTFRQWCWGEEKENATLCSSLLRSVTRATNFAAAMSSAYSLWKTIAILMPSIGKQESPPAWTQEAYHPPCSKYSLCCPNWVPPRPGYPPARVSPRLDLSGYPPRLDLAGYPPGCPMAFWEMLQSIMGYGYPPCGQTDWWTERVKTLPSRRTTYAGGKYRAIKFNTYQLK